MPFRVRGLEELEEEPVGFVAADEEVATSYDGGGSIANSFKLSTEKELLISVKEESQIDVELV